MPAIHWFRQARYLAVLFMIAAVIPVAVLSWLGLRLLKQDRDLEAQRIQQRLEDAADRVAAEFEAHLTRIEAKLTEMAASPPTELRSGAVFVTFSSSAVDAWPRGRLLYCPVHEQDQSRNDPFWPGERHEFQDGSYERAAALFRSLARSPNTHIQAGALVRLARNLRRLGRHESALSTYSRLEKLGDVTTGGVPAGLLGRHARCAVLEELGRLQELHNEADALCRGLQSGRWRLDRASYEFYSRYVRRWLAGSCEPGQNRISAALAAAVESLWLQWQSGIRTEADARGRRTLWLNGTSLLVLWQSLPDRFLSLVAAPSYLESEWRNVWENRQLLLQLADSEALRCAMWNILDNAAKYSPPDSAIEVSVASESGRLAIRVCDHGPGIPAAEQKKIFERFFRGTSTRDSVKGTGIGLALVRHIVVSHSGEVRLESAPGRGSTFTIYVPAMEGA